MSLSPFDSFQSRFVTYLLNFPRTDIFPLPMAQKPLVGQGLLIIAASRSHSGTPHSVGLLRTSDHPIAEHLYLTTNNYHRSQRIRNPQSQKASGNA